MRKEFLEKLYKEHQLCPTCPSPEEVAKFFRKLLGAMYLDFSARSFKSLESIEVNIRSLKLELDELIKRNPANLKVFSENVSEKFFMKLEKIYDKLNKDLQAIYDGDPAAQSRREIIRSYPGFYAIAAYRVAHELFKFQIEDLPRIISEHAHSQTGIDIHPGANIADYFCIDHGTGVVIGATSEIGQHVKIYQGVTLGALSVQKQDADVKRHPTIEENVVIYAGATILGGKTVIGARSVIGGNVWITRSVAPESKIYYQARMANMGDESPDIDSDLFVYKEYSK